VGGPVTFLVHGGRRKETQLRSTSFLFTPVSEKNQIGATSGKEKQLRRITAKLKQRFLQILPRTTHPRREEPAVS